MTEQQRVDMLEAQLEEKERALQEALARNDALRQQDAENAEIIGDLISRMVHDMNNLNTKIRSSSTTISHALGDVRQTLSTIMFDLEPIQQQAFLELLERACQQKCQATERLSLRQERQLRRVLCQELEAHQLAETDDMADVLVDMGIHDDVLPFLPILQDGRCEALLQAAYGLVSLHDVVQWNLNPVFGRIAHITHALRHMIVALLENQVQKTRIQQGVEQVLALFQDVLECRRIEVHRHFSEIPSIYCYAGLEIVWANLIENAIEAIDEKGTLDITISRHEDQVLVQIRDSGSGIPDGLRDSLFERDVTIKPSGSEVHGAGLYIARKIVLKHHGRITFESRPGETSAYVWLPVHLAKTALIAHG
jgi:signal transduction histidine kinase